MVKLVCLWIKLCFDFNIFWSIVNNINSNDNIASSTKAHLSILVANLLSLILFFISDSTSYFSVPNCSIYNNFWSFIDFINHFYIIFVLSYSFHLFQTIFQPEFAKAFSCNCIQYVSIFIFLCLFIFILDFLHSFIYILYILCSSEISHFDFFISFLCLPLCRQT